VESSSDCELGSFLRRIEISSCGSVEPQYHRPGGRSFSSSRGKCKSREGRPFHERCRARPSRVDFCRYYPLFAKVPKFREDSKKSRRFFDSSVSFALISSARHSDASSFGETSIAERFHVTLTTEDSLVTRNANIHAHKPEILNPIIEYTRH